MLDFDFFVIQYSTNQNNSHLDSLILSEIIFIFHLHLLA